MRSVAKMVTDSAVDDLIVGVIAELDGGQLHLHVEAVGSGLDIHATGGDRSKTPATATHGVGIGMAKLGLKVGAQRQPAFAPIGTGRCNAPIDVGFAAVGAQIRDIPARGGRD